MSKTRHRGTSADNKAVVAFRVSDKQIKAIRQQLERAALEGQKMVNMRRHRRLSYDRTPRFFVEMQHPGGTNVTYVVELRNISSTGVGFLHGAFAYDKAPCNVILRNLQNQWVRVPGSVARCRMIQGKIHEVGVKFDEPIEVSQFAADLADDSNAAA